MLILKLRCLFALWVLFHSVTASSNFDHYSGSIENVNKHQDKTQTPKFTSFKAQMKNVKTAVGIPSADPGPFNGPHQMKSTVQDNVQGASSHTVQNPASPKSTQLFQRRPGQSTNNVVTKNGQGRPPTQYNAGSATNQGNGNQPSSNYLSSWKRGQSNSNGMKSIYGQQEMDENMGYPTALNDQENNDMPTVEYEYRNRGEQMLHSTDSVNGDEMSQVG